MKMPDNEATVVNYAGGWGGLMEYTPKADDVIKLTKLAKEECGFDPNGNTELFERLLYVVYGAKRDGQY